VENDLSLLPHGQSPLYVSIQTSPRGISAIYIKVRQGDSVKTKEFDEHGEIILDLDAAGDLLGVEILSVTPELRHHMEEIAHQFNKPELLEHFHPEKLPQVFA
jgi:uncharacterized protein YuzE